MLKLGKPPVDLTLTAAYIKSLQRPDGAILWNTNDKLDPWDHVEAAMGLTVAGCFEQAQQAYAWLANNQLNDGSWHATYFLPANPTYLQKSQAHTGKETNFIAYVATGVWHYFLATEDHAFLARYYSVIEQALNFVLRFQASSGDISWPVDQQNQPQNDALLTACCSIARSLECGILAAKVLAKPHAKWQLAYLKLSSAILTKPHRFDRTWESKQRFAMDWYYPILAGLYTPTQAQAQLKKRWQEFVEPTLGCRCVSDEPWVTMAETCELVMALIHANHIKQANALFATLAQWQQADGGFVTGYVFTDKTIWPSDKTSWTAGAVLLAADALYHLTPAATLFTQTSHLFCHIQPKAHST